MAQGQHCVLPLRHSSGNKSPTQGHPRWDEGHGAGHKGRAPCSRCCDTGGMLASHCAPPSRCFSVLAHWPGWRSSGTRRPAGTSPCSRRRAGASWHGSTSRRGRFVMLLPSPLLCSQFRLKWAVQPFCCRLAQRLPLPPPPSCGELWGQLWGCGLGAAPRCRDGAAVPAPTL